MARKRRSGFASPQEALDRLGSKLPFSSLHPDALRAYLRHGLRRAAAADGGGSSSSGGGEQLWQLKCAPETEAAWFTAVGECIPIRTERVRCPVMVAVGAVGSSGASSSGSGQPSRSSTTSSSTGSGGNAQPQPKGADGSGGGDGGNIHGQLPLLGERLAEALPASLVRRYPRLSHFGPLQDPEGVASDAREFFLGVLQAQADGGSGSALRARGRAGGRAPLPASRL
ncbi:hypothetical protein MNEG_7262 [Monoraphidium neglectum]|uniref:Uncharacterized protein n=1 Tax=Monoraphidium neglectum TaxID=145388 RepID=A0A0D2MJC4_9CHLO|nr:hypothetical protein MNEG_7262 [Monoraphidium neglectum]KIZ00702.1 hypothetical protein MNEG_7262 [Monoraphidium neglectum]|eukprot:XP_013899721.1 hypothetical protein MNEG_7262 [Monoraphidium neglectum]